MKNFNKILLIFIGAIVLLLLVLLFVQNNNTQKQNELLQQQQQQVTLLQGGDDAEGQEVLLTDGEQIIDAIPEILAPAPKPSSQIVCCEFTAANPYGRPWYKSVDRSTCGDPEDPGIVGSAREEIVSNNFCEQVIQTSSPVNRYISIPFDEEFDVAISDQAQLQGTDFFVSVGGFLKPPPSSCGDEICSSVPVMPVISLEYSYAGETKTASEIVYQDKERQVILTQSDVQLVLIESNLENYAVLEFVKK